MAEQRSERQKRVIKERKISLTEKMKDDKLYNNFFGDDDSESEDEDYSAIEDAQEVSDEYDSDFLREMNKKNNFQNLIADDDDKNIHKNNRIDDQSKSEIQNSSENENNQQKSQFIEEQEKYNLKKSEIKYNKTNQESIVIEDDDKSDNSEEKNKQFIINKMQQQKIQFLNNKIAFPFVRGLHWMFNLLDLERNGASYATVKDNFTYKNKSEVINRCVLGIPQKIVQNIQEQLKTQYETYLWKREDEKYLIDQHIVRAKFVKKNLNKILKKNVFDSNILENTQEVKYINSLQIMGKPYHLSKYTKEEVEDLLIQIENILNYLTQYLQDQKELWCIADQQFFKISLESRQYNEKLRQQQKYESRFQEKMLSERFYLSQQLNLQKSDGDEVVEEEDCVQVQDFDKLFDFYNLNNLEKKSQSQQKNQKQFQNFLSSHYYNQKKAVPNMLAPSFIFRCSEQESWDLTFQLISNGFQHSKNFYYEKLQQPFQQLAKNLFGANFQQDNQEKFDQTQQINIIDLEQETDTNQFKFKLDTINLKNITKIEKFLHENVEIQQKLNENQSKISEENDDSEQICFDSYIQYAEIEQYLHKNLDNFKEEPQIINEKCYFPILQNSNKKILFTRSVFFNFLTSILILNKKIETLFKTIQILNIADLNLDLNDLFLENNISEQGITLKQFFIEILLKISTNELEDYLQERIFQNFKSISSQFLNIKQLIKYSQNYFIHFYGNDICTTLYKPYEQSLFVPNSQNKYYNLLAQAFQNSVYKKLDEDCMQKLQILRVSFDQKNRIFFIHQLSKQMILPKDYQSNKAEQTNININALIPQYDNQIFNLNESNEFTKNNNNNEIKNKDEKFFQKFIEIDEEEEEDDDDEDDDDDYDDVNSYDDDDGEEQEDGEEDNSDIEQYGIFTDESESKDSKEDMRHFEKKLSKVINSKVSNQNNQVIILSENSSSEERNEKSEDEEQQEKIIKKRKLE